MQSTTYVLGSCSILIRPHDVLNKKTWDFGVDMFGDGGGAEQFEEPTVEDIGDNVAEVEQWGKKEAK